MDFVGVTYGFGFKEGEEYTFRTVSSCKELMDYLYKV